MNERDKIYFVWINHGGNVYPQKWYGDKINSENGRPRYIIEGRKVELKDQERNLTLDELAAKYPCERKIEE